MFRPLFPLLLTLFALCCPSFVAMAQSSAAQTAKGQTQSLPDSITDQQLGEATAKTTRLLFVTKKDTVVFDFDALINESNASLGDAIKKLPGMEVRDGKLYFNGKIVERLMVNGIDFSRENPQLALSQLPAYIVKNVKTYERKTETAMQTGIDDGVRQQVVDVILRKEYHGTWTGKGVLSGGTSNTFSMRGFANTFTDRFRITAFGNANNLNQPIWFSGNGREEAYYNGNGRNTYRSPGASFFWKTDREEGKRGYFLVEMSGDYNHDALRNEDRSETEDYLEMGNTFSARHSLGRGRETRWVAHPSIKWNPTDWTFIQYRADMYRSTVRNRSRTANAKWSENPFSPNQNALDTLLLRPEAWPNPQAVTTLTQHLATSEVKTWNYSHFFYFTQRLSENNWRFAYRNQVFDNTNDSRNFNLNNYRYYQSAEKPRELLNRYVTGDSYHRGQNSFFDLNIPVVKHWFFRTTYGYTTTRTKNTREGYLLNLLGTPYNDFQTAAPLLGLLPDAQTQWQAKTREAETTRFTNNFVRKHWAELYWQYSHNGWYYQTQATLRFARENLDYEKAEETPLHYNRRFRDGNISSLLKYENDSIGRFELKYDYEHSAPQYLSMITLPDRSDPLHISLGNPNLKHKQRHNIVFEYFKTNPISKGCFISFLRSAIYLQFLDNDVLYARAYNRTTGATTSMPVNVSGQWNGAITFYGSTSSEKPIHGSLYANYGINRGKSLETQSDFAQLHFQQTDQHNLMGGVRLTWRKGDFELHLPFYYNFIYYRSDFASVNGKTSMTYTLRPELNWKLPHRFEFMAYSDIQLLRGYGSEIARRNRCGLHFKLSRTFLKSRDLTLSLAGNDLLNQNDGFQVYRSATSLSRSYSETLGRHIMLGVSYRFSSKKAKATPAHSDYYDEED